MFRSIFSYSAGRHGGPEDFSIAECTSTTYFWSTLFTLILQTVFLKYLIYLESYLFLLFATVYVSPNETMCCKQTVLDSSCWWPRSPTEHRVGVQLALKPALFTSHFSQTLQTAICVRTNGSPVIRVKESHCMQRSSIRLGYNTIYCNVYSGCSGHRSNFCW